MFCSPHCSTGNRENIPGGYKHEKATIRKKRAGSFGHWSWLHGHELWIRPCQRQEGDDYAHSDGRGAWRYLLRHGRDLRPFYQRGTGGGGARAASRPGGDRHQVRLRYQCRSHQDKRGTGPEQPPRPYHAGRRGLAQATQGRGHRSVLSAPC